MTRQVRTLVMLYTTINLFNFNFIIPTVTIKPIHSLSIFHIICLLFHNTLNYLIVSSSITSLSTWYPFITSYSHIPSFSRFIVPVHRSRFCPYRLHSNNTCFSVSTPTQIILVLSFHSSTRSFCHEPYFSNNIVICKTASSMTVLHHPLYVLLNPSFHTSLPTSCILSHMHFFHTCCCCCLPTPMTLASGGSPMFPLVIHQPASPSIWPAVQSLRWGLSTNPGVTI